MDEGAGCIGAVILLALFGWVPLHFSGKALLYYRESKSAELTYFAGSTIVTCKYFNSTGTEETFKITAYPEQFYCPRYKDVGQ